MLIEEALPANQTSSRALQQSLFSLLQSCNSVKKLAQIHTQIVVNGFYQKSFILVKFLSLYIASGNLLHACRVFEHSKNPCTAVWNQIIRGHASSEAPRRSFELYNRMVVAEAEPDGFTYSFVLSACAKSGLLREGQQVHGRVISNGLCANVFVQTNLVNLYAVAERGTGFGKARCVFDEMTERSIVSWNSLLAAYMRCGDIDGAWRTFDEMPERNVISWTTMVSGCAQHGKCRQALSLFSEMQRGRVALDQVALVAVLSACAELGDLKLGRWIHSYIDETLRVQKQPLLVSLQNALIHMYASCGVIEEAYNVFKKMPQRSTVSWTSMITGFAKQGRAGEALNVFQLMQSLGGNQVRPDEITFIGVLCACSHAGLVDMGHHYFQHMIQHWCIEPRIEHYGCMVDLLSRAGFLDEAHRLIGTMPMRPNDAVWGAVLGGCRIYKNAELASRVAQNLAVELNPDQAAGYLVLLKNIYASAKRWNDVAGVRQKMVEMGVRKTPGRSWIQINGVVHDFMAGDRTHKHASSIYDMLGEILRQVKQESCKRDTTEIILDVDQ
ncbi:pentatricopeptide repeat-containing protein At5g66520-like [Malania oleifera]|uniref:pentatricopeptide repeat-containing protein At5g66520-like n=1 Tax=Malania oleifera TaxID=397392 RepID=UPI0025AE875F|nr:pentatricopeptide repeat-containing protein At5g66520-like [Malania oleifera]